MDHEHFMDIAIELSHKGAAQGNPPVGSVIVDKDGEIVAQGANEVNSDIDPTAHGEIVAIRRAARKLNSIDLSGCTLYTAMEPCPMCCWAMVAANVSRVVLGGRHAGLGRKYLGEYSIESMLRYTGAKLEVVTGVRARECEELRRAWNAANAGKPGAR